MQVTQPRSGNVEVTQPVIVVDVGEVSGPPGPQGLQGIPGPQGPQGLPGERVPVNVDPISLVGDGVYYPLTVVRPILIDPRVMAGDGVDVPLTVIRIDGGTY